VLGLSLELYNDPEPCMIHRGAVLKRIYMQIIDALEGRGVQPASSLPRELCRCLDAYGGAAVVELIHRDER